MSRLFIGVSRNYSIKYWKILRNAQKTGCLKYLQVARFLWDYINLCGGSEITKSIILKYLIR